MNAMHACTHMLTAGSLARRLEADKAPGATARRVRNFNRVEKSGPTINLELKAPNLITHYKCVHS